MIVDGPALDHNVSINMGGSVTMRRHLGMFADVGPAHQVSFNGGSFTGVAALGNTSPSSVTTLSRKRSAVVGHGASASVEVHVDEGGSPLLAEKIIRVLSEEKSKVGKTELAFAARQLDLEPQPDCLVHIHGAYHDSTEQCVHILMEYMDGGHAGRMAPVPEPVLAAMTRQLVAGLRVLHDELRVVHRDLKPENVLLNSAGRVKIADFGVAALLPPGVDAATDQQGTILQMSPERLRGEPHGFASDVWSLGVTVAQLATGRHPFVPDGAVAESTERFWLLAEVIRHTASAEECEAATRAAVDKALAAASPELRDFVLFCLRVAPQTRANPVDLAAHPFVALADPSTLAARCARFHESA